MGKRGKRGIPLDCLGPAALRQLEGLGVDVRKQLEHKKLAPVSPTPRTPSAPYNKYGVAPSDTRTCDGIVFASKLEMTVYRFLAGRGLSFERQVEYVIQDGFAHGEQVLRPVLYFADFRLRLPSGGHLVIDAKGILTPVFRLKQKLLLKQGVEIHCVRNVNELALLLSTHGLMQGSSSSEHAK